jgi:hypothetical protein
MDTVYTPSRSFLISKIKTFRNKTGQFYSSCYVDGGKMDLEKAPYRNLLGFYRALTGRKSKSGPLEKQLEFKF